MTGFSERTIRRIVADLLPGRKVKREAIELLRSSLDQTARYVVTRAAQQHDLENRVRRQMGDRPRVRLNERHMRIALGVEPEQGQDGHA